MYLTREYVYACICVCPTGWAQQLFPEWLALVWFDAVPVMHCFILIHIIALIHIDSHTYMNAYPYEGTCMQVYMNVYTYIPIHMCTDSS